jgi:inactivated superfamily I helicase/RecB family exonuclease
MLETLASLITKDGGDLSNVLAFVPTRRAARGLEKLLGAGSAAATIVPLGEGGDMEDADDVVGNTERKIILAKLLMSVHDKIGAAGNFKGAMDTANELLVLSDYLENEGIDIKGINWSELVPDERKVKFLTLASKLDLGMSKAAERNKGIVNWKNRLGDYRAVFCAGSTASVKSTRDLMIAIANLPNGRVLIPGLVENMNDIGRADPYWSIKKFIKSADVPVETIDAGGGDKIAFFNRCFDNDLSGKKLNMPEHVRRMDCATESEEATVAAEIAARARRQKKSVLIVTPDSAGEQRIKTALSEYGLSADSSGGTPLSMTPIGRFAVRLFDYIAGNENKDVVAADLGQSRAALDALEYKGDLLGFIKTAMEKLDYNIGDDDANADAADLFFDKVSELSKILNKYKVDAADAALMLSETLKDESVRPKAGRDYDVGILGTAESRMQTADVVIITGLADGMFPAGGFEHDWLPKNIAHKIGLPDSDSKVSLMALDFITLSCGREVWWTWSKMMGGTEAMPSRFLSRVKVMTKAEEGADTEAADVLIAVRAKNDVPFAPLDRTPPSVKYAGDYYATWLESLIHNPYLFYARHILKLRRGQDCGDEAGAREFGTLIHGVMERCAGIKDEQEIIRRLEDAAKKIVGNQSVLFRFWQNRFREMAGEIAKLSSRPAELEKEIATKYNGHAITARVDRIESGSKVMDYKTGQIPSDAQLGLGKDANCTIPQLPLEAMILRDKIGANKDVSMAFLSLKKNAVGVKEYDASETSRSIDALQKKLNVILNKEEYKRPEYVEEKYRDFDDLCRADD